MLSTLEDVNVVGGSLTRALTFEVSLLQKKKHAEPKLGILHCHEQLQHTAQLHTVDQGSQANGAQDNDWDL